MTTSSQSGTHRGAETLARVSRRILRQASHFSPRPVIAAIALLTSLLFAPSAFAIRPESGIYWSQFRPGEGMVLEMQGDIVSAALYSYTASGQPEFYIASGRLEEGGDSEPAPWTEGYWEQMHHMVGDLFRVKDGPVFNSSQHFQIDAPAPYQAERIGRLTLIFAYHAGATVRVRLDEPLPPGANLYKERFLERMNVGYDILGQSPSPKFACLHDWRGEWVFVDQGNSERAPWRFRFTELSTAPDRPLNCEPQASDPPQIFAFRDPAQGATLRCILSHGSQADPLDGRRHNGCELRLDDQAEPVFYISYPDFGLNRLHASPGPLPDRSDPTRVILRGPASQRIIGLRVE